MSTSVNTPSSSDASANAHPGSLPKGLAILELLSSDSAPMGVTALARHMAMPKSGVHRLLQVLRELGWVRQVPDGEYECTLKLWELGQRVANRVDLRAVSAAAMQELAAQTRETIMLSILDGTDVLYMDVIDSPQAVRAHTRPGDRAPAFCMATGKAMLAHAPASVIDAVVKQFEVFTPLTITSRQQLEQELDVVRRKGYALNQGEWTGGVRGVAAPIFDSRGQAVAAISIGAPADRLSASVIRGMAPLVINAASRISGELGHRP